MTVSTTLNKITYAGNGATTVFPFTFPGVSAASIQVFFTDALGNATLLSPSAYTLSLNPASGTNPTGAGGSVTYNPLGVPIPTGTSLTILRNLSLTQTTSLANQGTLYQPVEEAALDYAMMVSQQVLEVQSRALVVPVSDPTPGDIPAVASRANLFAAYDSLGNPIAAQPSGASTPVSSVMSPVVNSATLAAARAALGLGNIATDNVGAGLAVLAGSVIVQNTIVADSSNQAIGAAQHLNLREATGALIYTLAQSSTLFNGFGFYVSALTAAVTLAINAADKFSGGATGASMIIPPGTQAFIVTDGAGNWYLSGVDAPGITDVINVQLNATVSANALTIFLKDRNGNDPSTASPVILAFPDATIANGDPVIRAITSALSITVPSTATLGTVSNQAARLWVGLFDNAGTPVLGVYNSLNSTGPSIACWDETSPATGTAIAGGSNTPQTWYTNGTVTSKSFRILGYVEATEAVAGTWATAPSKVRLFGPGVKKPGDVIQSTSAIINSSGATASATFVALANQSVNITPSSAANPISVSALALMNQTINSTSTFQLSRGTVANTNMIGFQASFNLSSTVFAGATPVPLAAYDLPNTTSSTTYAIQGRTTAGTVTSSTPTFMQAQEIQI